MTRKTKTQYLSRTLMAGPYMALFITEHDFLAELESLGIEERINWVSKGSDASVHTLEKDNQLICLVCVKPDPERDALETITLIVHEAVHVWQQAMRNISEHQPSREFEAYSIQSISHTLILDYIRQIEAKDQCTKKTSRK